MNINKGQMSKDYLKNIIPNIVACFCLSIISQPLVHAEIITNVTIDGYKYDLDTEAKKAKVKQGPKHKSPYHLVIPETIVHESITYVITEIADVSYASSYSNYYITGITLPNTIEYIGNWAFRDCKNFKGDLIIPNSVKHIGNSSFSNCAGTGKLVLGNGIEYIGQHAFKECKFTGMLNIPESTTYIDDGAFHYCSFTGPLIIPDSVTYLGNSAFRCMTGISGNLYIGKSVNNIGVSCFSDGTCDHLNAIEIYGSNLKIVNTTGNPFSSQNSDCRLIYLSNQVKSITRDIFATIHYKNVEEVISDNSTPPAFTSDGGHTGAGFYGTVKDNAVLKVPKKSIQEYQSATYWKDFKNIQEFNPEPTEILLNTTEISLFVNDNFTLSAKIYPSYANNHSIKWESSNEAIVEVDESGKITAKALGVAQITAITNNNLSTTCLVIVKPILATGITLNLQNMTLSTGETKKLTATVTPNNVTNGSVVWSSENEDIAAVDKDGYVTAISMGSTKIIASATDDSGVSAECAVVVSKLGEIDDIITDKSVYVQIFNLNGILVYEGLYSEAALLPDYYIVVCNNKNVKVKIK